MAFVAFYDSEYGIFTGPDLLADKVIATGDPLAGSTVTDVFSFRNGLNDSGQVAFYAQLDDGRSGIFRADPVPEPGSLTMLCAFVALGLAGYSRRRRNRARCHDESGKTLRATGSASAFGNRRVPGWRREMKVGELDTRRRSEVGVVGQSFGARIVPQILRISP